MDMGADIGFAGIKHMIIGTFFTVLATGVVITVTDLVTHSADSLVTGSSIYLLIGTVHRKNPVIAVYHHERLVMTLNQRCQID
jgi:hypothetical protein